MTASPEKIIGSWFQFLLQQRILHAAHIKNLVQHCLACLDLARFHKAWEIPCRLVPKNNRAMAQSGHSLQYHHHWLCVASCSEILLSDEITLRRLIKWLTDVFARFGTHPLQTYNGTQFTFDESAKLLLSSAAAHGCHVGSFNRMACRHLILQRIWPSAFRIDISVWLLPLAPPGGQNSTEFMFGRSTCTEAQFSIIAYFCRHTWAQTWCKEFW